MHELGLTKNIIAIVTEHAKGRKIKRVRLSVGPQACVETRALEFCFDIVAAGTVAENATLEILPASGDTFLIKEFETEEAA